jgi:hypothetical protein
MLNTVAPILFTMMQKLLMKGYDIEVVEAAAVWCGRVKDIQLTNRNRADKEELTIEVKVFKRNPETGVTVINSFDIIQPERWRLTKGGEGWLLIPPRAQGDK